MNGNIGRNKKFFQVSLSMEGIDYDQIGIYHSTAHALCHPHILLIIGFPHDLKSPDHQLIGLAALTLDELEWCFEY